MGSFVQYADCVGDEPGIEACECVGLGSRGILYKCHSVTMGYGRKNLLDAYLNLPIADEGDILVGDKEGTVPERIKMLVLGRIPSACADAIINPFANLEA